MMMMSMDRKSTELAAPVRPIIEFEYSQNCLMYMASLGGAVSPMTAHWPHRGECVLVCDNNLNLAQENNCWTAAADNRISEYTSYER